MHCFSKGKIIHKDSLKGTIKKVYTSLKIDNIEKPYMYYYLYYRFSFASYVCSYINHIYTQSHDLADWHISYLFYK